MSDRAAPSLQHTANVSCVGSLKRNRTSARYTEPSFPRGTHTRGAHVVGMYAGWGGWDDFRMERTNREQQQHGEQDPISKVVVSDCVQPASHVHTKAQLHLSSI